MDLRNVCLSIYSFGYGAGFICDSRYPGASPALTLDGLFDLCARYSLGGVELPLDRFCPDADRDALRRTIENVRQRDLLLRVDIERFDVSYVKSTLPVLAEFGIEFVRVKTSDFYGGNRYKHPEFERDSTAMEAGIDALLPSLERAGIRLLIENHQDIVIADIERMWRRFGRDWIGINWDIGNSVASCETPLSFLRKTRPQIGNVHLKDYRLIRCESGYRLVRCALGDGVMGLGNIVRILLETAPSVPLTIELGAMNARTADIHVDGYWEALPPFDERDRSEFLAFINRYSVASEEWQSAWERRQDPQKIFASELLDLDRSVAYLRQAGSTDN